MLSKTRVIAAALSASAAALLAASPAFADGLSSPAAPAVAATAHQFLTGFGGGVFTRTQPTASDINVVDPDTSFARTLAAMLQDKVYLANKGVVCAGPLTSQGVANDSVIQSVANLHAGGFTDYVMPPGADCPLYSGIATFTGSITGTTLAASNVSGYITMGAPITGASQGTYIVAQLSGTPNGAGTYQVSSSQTVSSAAMTQPAHVVIQGNGNTFEGAGPGATLISGEGDLAPIIKLAQFDGVSAVYNDSVHDLQLFRDVPGGTQGGAGLEADIPDGLYIHDVFGNENFNEFLDLGGINVQLSHFTTYSQQPNIPNSNPVTGASWASTSGGQETFVTSFPHNLGVGVGIHFSGFVPSSLNGDYVTLAGTAGSTVVVAMATNPGTPTTFGYTRDGAPADIRESAFVDATGAHRAPSGLTVDSGSSISSSASVGIEAEDIDTIQASNSYIGLNAPGADVRLKRNTTAAGIQTAKFVNDFLDGTGDGYLVPWNNGLGVHEINLTGMTVKNHTTNVCFGSYDAGTGQIVLTGNEFGSMGAGGRCVEIVPAGPGAPTASASSVLGHGNLFNSAGYLNTSCTDATNTGACGIATRIIGVGTLVWDDNLYQGGTGGSYLYTQAKAGRVNNGSDGNATSYPLYTWSAPLITVLTGSGTYTKPYGATWGLLKMVGAGSGGGGSGGGASVAGGTVGGASTVTAGGTTYTAPGGAASGSFNVGSPPGAAATNCDISRPGGGGEAGVLWPNAVNAPGGAGGASFFAPATFDALSAGIGSAGVNGSGGGGAGIAGTGSVYAGAGGSGGTDCEKYLSNLPATFTFVMGAGGAGGAGGASPYAGNQGGMGGAGYGTLEAHFEPIGQTF